ncbi:MAG TPA: hypothetical protein VJQ82_07240, partial [Terriglobales bacterium]|nr:hypothetical protein [Terriglobales bacterium]
MSSCEVDASSLAVFRPDGAGVSSAAYPRLAPWALFLRRFAAFSLRQLQRRLAVVTLQRSFAWGLIISLVALCGCNRDKAKASGERAETKSSMVLPNLAEASPLPADLGPVPSVDGEKAFAYTKQVVAFGPRPIGSEAHKKLEAYIYAHLKGDLTEDDYFVASTPVGKLPVRNILAKFPGARDGVVVLAGHYDTNYPLKNKGYVGANDGGSST